MLQDNNNNRALAGRCLEEWVYLYEKRTRDKVTSVETKTINVVYTYIRTSALGNPQDGLAGLWVEPTTRILLRILRVLIYSTKIC